MTGQISNFKIQNHSSKSKDNLKTRAYKLSLNIIQLADSMSFTVSSRIILNQVVRSITSIGANLVEAKGSSSKREFKKYFEIALKSANESKYWLGLLRDAKLVDEGRVDALLLEVTELSNIIAKSVLTMKGKTKI